jgi:hypothetical protein
VRHYFGLIEVVTENFRFRWLCLEDKGRPIQQNLEIRLGRQPSLMEDLYSGRTREAQKPSLVA